MATATFLRDSDGLLHVVGGEPDEVDVSAELVKAVAIARDTTGMAAMRDDKGTLKVTVTTVQGVFEYTCDDETEDVFRCRRVDDGLSVMDVHDELI